MTLNQNQSLKELFHLYLSECEHIKKLRKATIRGYEEVFVNFQNLVPEVQTLADLTPLVFSQFLNNLIRRERNGKQGVRESTLRTYYDKLVAFFRWLERYNYLPKGSLASRVVKPPLPRYEDEKALSNNDIAKIISAISIERINNPFLLKRDLLMVSILAYTGVRKGELLGLRVLDVDTVQRNLLVNAQTSKSKKSRSIPINSILLTHLLAYLAERRKRGYTCEYLLVSSQSGNRLTEHGLKHWVKRYSELSKVSFHMHQFRHTFACALAKNSADISSIKSVLGHSSIAMTERYLRSISTENARTYIESLSY